jgi:hypothetical protein
VVVWGVGVCSELNIYQSGYSLWQTLYVERGKKHFVPSALLRTYVLWTTRTIPQNWKNTLDLWRRARWHFVTFFTNRNYELGNSVMDALLWTAKNNSLKSKCSCVIE